MSERRRSNRSARPKPTQARPSKGDSTLFLNAAELVTCERAQQDCVLHDAGLLVTNGRIAAIGAVAELRAAHADVPVFDCGGGVLTPGFVDSHTHAVFGAWRAAEYELRARGLDYMEIARRGGGINASVRDLRSRNEDELVALTDMRLQQMLRHGTTTVEIKSGYGLDVANELKMLRVIQRVGKNNSLEVVATFLGAHEVPTEFRDRRQEYVRLVIDEMLPAAAEVGVARFCDVFMEPGAFSASEARAILEAGLRHGLTPKLHADEFEHSGGAELAAELGAASADHLGAISPDGIAALARSATVATLLPATLFFLGKRAYAPARRLLESGATVALATDFNPGTAPSPSMPLVLTMACSQMAMTPLEALVAATSGGAKALRLAGVGSLIVGAQADLVLWEVAGHNEIPYRFGDPPVKAVWKRGIRVI